MTTTHELPYGSTKASTACRLESSCRCLLTLLDGLALVLVEDPQDIDEAEGGSQATQNRLMGGIDLGHGPRPVPAAVARRGGPEV
jgi:hypothetical protein